MRAIYKKELRSYFTSVVGWVFIAFFLFLSGIFFMIYNLESGLLDISYVFDEMQIFFVLLLVPVLTMKVIADETRQKTDQLLYTSPVSVTKIVLGKYFALLTLLAIALLVICVYPILLNSLANKGLEEAEQYAFNFVASYGSIFGFFFLGAAYIAIGLFVSSLTESQVIAAVVSGVVMTFSMFMTGITNMLPTDGRFMYFFFAILIIFVCVGLKFWIHNGWLAALIGILAEIVLFVLFFNFTESFDGLLHNIMSNLSLADRYEPFTQGIFDVSALLYYISACFLFIFITIQRIKKKQYN